MDNSREIILLNLEKLLTLYKDNEFAIKKIEKYICETLPNTLITDNMAYEEKLEKYYIMTSEQEKFIKIFLISNKYYYLHINDSFYHYDGMTYKFIKLDDIIHKLLTTITHDNSKLMEWKHKTKNIVIKNIRQRNLFSSTPETFTIQKVLKLFMLLTGLDKNYSKYFLTSLGDVILKKNTNIYFVNSNTKQFIIFIDELLKNIISNFNITNGFILKYHDNHDYSNCRIINIKSIFDSNIWNENFNNLWLDLFCVSTHYSNRYGSSDDYIHSSNDDTSINSICFLKNISSKELLFQYFCDKYISVIETKESIKSYSVDMKNVLFIWKHFLNEYQLPNVIYLNTIKSMMTSKFEFDDDRNVFLNITSKYFPLVVQFGQFWNENITYIDSSSNTVIPYGFKIGEIYRLFQKWNYNNNNKYKSNTLTTRDHIHQIIDHFYSENLIFKEKYIINITCKLWNKSDDINKSIEFTNTLIQRNSYTDNDYISFEDLYDNYNLFCKNNEKNIVSKSFFENSLLTIIDDKFIYTNSGNNSLDISFFLN